MARRQLSTHCSGTLSCEAETALAAIADIVFRYLRDGGDNNHRAIMGDGPSMIERHAANLG